MNSLEFRNIKHTYNGKVVLDIPDLAIERGQSVALAGPNGCGKTTLLTIAALLLHPDSGDVLIDGEVVDRRNPEIHRSKISFMAQEPFFFRGSLVKNMEFSLKGSNLSREETAARMDKYLSLLEIGNIRTRSPRTFSTGEKKRAAIARALCRETSIILLDEPFTHIDSMTTAILEEVLRSLPDDRTVVFSTHGLSHAYRLADTIVTLQDGMLAPCTPENLFNLTAYTTDDGAELRNGSGPSIYYPGDLEEGRKYLVSLNPSEVLLSMESIEASTRNSYQGQIKRIESTGSHTVLVTVECPPDFPIRAAITERTMREFGLSVGDPVWVHFKSTAIHVLNGSNPAGDVTGA